MSHQTFLLEYVVCKIHIIQKFTGVFELQQQYSENSERDQNIHSF